MAETLIEWTDRVWNFLRGCFMVSEGCRHCYAMKQAHRFSGPGMPYEGLTELGPDGPRWTGKIRMVEDKLTEPLHVRKPQKWFVNSMSDLFHEDVPFEFIDRAFAVMALCPQHTFQILTKRPERMREYMSERLPTTRWMDYARVYRKDIPIEAFNARPLPNVWLGVSVENQQYADERIPPLLQTPAAVRFISYEPALGPVDLTKYLQGISNSERRASLSWVIIGGESGPGARPFDLGWARKIIEQAKPYGTKIFMKQLGAFPVEEKEVGTAKGGCHVPLKLHSRKGNEMEEWPQDLRRRESV